MPRGFWEKNAFDRSQMDINVYWPCKPFSAELGLPSRADPGVWAEGAACPAPPLPSQPTPEQLPGGRLHAPCKDAWAGVSVFH